LWIGMGFSIAAAVFDHFENRQILEMMGSEETSWAEFLPLLALFTWLKWGSIVLVFLILGWFLKGQNSFGKVIFGTALLSAAMGVVAGFMPAMALYFTGFVFLLFLLLFFWEVSFRARSIQN